MSQRYARKLLQQIERNSPESAHWIISALNSLATDNPKMTIAEVLKIVTEEMPEAAAGYREYVRTS